MKNEFETSMMGDLRFFIGLQVNKTSHGVLISQQKCIFKLFKIYKMEDVKPINTPSATSTKLYKDEPSPSLNETMYQGKKHLEWLTFLGPH